MEKGTILLIDDDMDMLLIGQRIFGRAGYTLVTARTGKEGLEKIVVEKPDLVILDFILPDINGKQFLLTLAKEDEYKKYSGTPVIILTARADFINDLDQFLELGLKAYLNKPFGHRELVNVVDNIIKIHQSEVRRQETEMAEKKLPHMFSSLDSKFDIALYEEVNKSAHTIIGLCQMFMDSYKERLSENQLVDLLAIFNSCRNLVKLVEGSNFTPKTKSELVSS